MTSIPITPSPRRTAIDAFVRLARPDARFISWTDLDERDAEVAACLRQAVTDIGYRLSDVALYERDGEVSMMFPPEVPV